MTEKKRSSPQIGAIFPRKLGDLMTKKKVFALKQPLQLTQKHVAKF
jgi:hypothetical protein